MKIKIVAIFLALLLLPGIASSEEDRTLERAEKYESRIPAEVVKELPIPKGYHEGLYFDGSDIWLCNGENENIWVIDIKTGKVKSEIKPVGEFTEGITAAGDGTYWLTDWEDKKIYKVKMADGEMSVEYEIDLSPAHPAGVVWTGKRLYMITWTRSVVGTEYHLMQLNEKERMFRKMRIKRIHEPAHLAWDGKYLWITSWYSRMVYKVNVDTFKIIGSFHSPAKDTTGIAWDGKHFWITGTRANLYQVKVGESGT
ncbi:MAG: glutaminyl-peptide cyclotransferase [Candidatus Omnitrophota bacterium]